MKNIIVFYLKILKFLEEKFSIYLNRRVFVISGFFYFSIQKYLVDTYQQLLMSTNNIYFTEN